MTSWEDVINQVVIPGEPQGIFGAQSQWSQTLGSTTSAKSTLDSGLTGLRAWHGDAGDVYRKRISDLAKALDGVIQGITPIPNLLYSAGTQMSTALNAIPIPGEMAQEVAKARSDYALTFKLQGFSNGTIDSIMTSWANSRWNVAAMAEANLPMFNSFMTGIRDWFSSNDNIATKAYDNLNTGYTQVSSHMPDPSASVLGAAALTPMPTTPGPDFGGAGGVPKLGAASLPGAGGLDPMGGVDPLGGTGTGPPFDTGLPGDTDLPGSGLAGVGGPGGGLSGIGGAGGGLGGGPGLSGAGLAGLGTGTSLPAGTVKGLGPVTSPFGGAGMPGMPGVGAGAGGARGRGATAAGRNGGLLGGTGAGAGRGGQGDEHATWLQEDEDVWGTDTGAAPPLLT